MNRRDFLKKTGGIAVFTIVPRHVLGKGLLAPSDQLTKGIIGTGGMGCGHLNYGGTRLIAVCDVDKKHLQQGMNLVTDKLRRTTISGNCWLIPMLILYILLRPLTGTALCRLKLRKQAKISGVRNR